ncbi:MAG: transporter substrate-binding domain-containing protein [Alysiella sp.]|uniref:transporter substrate-binding domain-containing protein n=1 Tax=Alysiella sp. TaxID=1872483 RepID=UPI0026DAFFC1|nr:transporter substrate-binding domain-containing protein [Alysiella sp.]MDO4432959.1 transporter substrate-binding domain-containing protein [Alysiella sp.]
MKLTPLYLTLSALLLSACQGGNTQQSTTPAAPQKASAPALMAAATTQQPLLERLNNKGTIIVATEGDYAPFTFTDKDGKLTGYDVEVMRAVGEKLGVKVEFRTIKWVGILPGVKSGEFDFAANQVTLTSPERQAEFDQAIPYSWSGDAIIVRNDNNSITSLETLKGKVGLQSSTSSYGEIAKKAGASVLPVESFTQAANLIQKGNADFTINGSLAALDYLKKNPQSSLKIAWMTPREEQTGAGIVTVKNNANGAVIAKINEAMVALQADGTLKRLGEQFFGQDVSLH